MKTRRLFALCILLAALSVLPKVTRKANAMLYDWREPRFRRRKRSDKIELIGGPGDGIVMLGSGSQFVYHHEYDATTYVYRANPDDISHPRKAYFVDECELRPETDGSYSVWLPTRD